MRMNLERPAAVVLMVVSAQFLLAAAGIAEDDHLKGYRIKDLNEVPAPQSLILETRFGAESCTLKKAQFFFVPGERNSGDDPNGGPAGTFVCYKAKCTGAPPPVSPADSDFGNHSLEVKKAAVVCIPADTYACGDGDIDPGEECDGSDSGGCPDGCLTSCTCAPRPCPAGGAALACNAVSAFDDCGDCCAADAACATACAIASASNCSGAAENDLCTAATNAAGCAARCCLSLGGGAPSLSRSLTE